MADPRRTSGVGESLEKLKGQIQAIQTEREEFDALQKEVGRLRKDSTATAERLQRREEKIELLEKKVAKLSQENQQLWTQRRNRKIGGFRLLSKHDPGYRNIRDDDPMSGGDLSLNELADHWQQKNKQPSIQPISLHEHQWRVSAIIPEKETDEDEDSPNGNQGMETENNGLQGEKANSGSEKLASEQEGLMSPTELRSSKPNDPRCNSPANSTFEQGNGDKKRPFSSIADGDSAQQPAVDRKSVCVYCWEWRKKCDSEAQCKNCQVTGVRCVRKLCEEGDRCKGRRCPCLHPGEWDQQDPEWIVEGGFLPKQRDLSEC